MPFIAKLSMAAPSALIGAAGMWHVLAKRLPSVAEEEWPYVGASLRRNYDVPEQRSSTEQVLNAA